MRKKIPVVIFCACLLGILAASMLMIREELPYREAEIISKEMAKQYTEEIEEGEDAWMNRQIDFVSLQKKNNDVIGWITIPDTEIDYAICQRKDDPNYYLQHDAAGNEQNLGAIFADNRLSRTLTDEHIILYGHNMRTGQMFGNLSSYLDETYYKMHPQVYIYLPTQTLKLEVYSSYVCTTSDAAYQIGEKRGTKEYKSWLSQTTEKSLIKSEAFVQDTDRIITLSTCADGNDASLRLVVHCMVTEEKEITI